MTTNSLTAIHKKKLVSRKHAESDALFLSIGEGAILIDERGHVSRINKVALHILGFDADELTGKWYPGTVIAEEANGKKIPNLELPITEAFLSGKSIFRRVYYRRRDGSRVPVALTVSPVMIDDQPIGAIEVFRDITEEIELENAKDEFISIASHQLRTPATVVKQHIGMMLEGYIGALSKDQCAILRTAYEHNDNQLTIIDDLLKVAQLDANKIQMVRKTIDLKKLLCGVVDSQQPAFLAQDIDLVFNPPKQKIRCRVDPLHIRMAVENLLDNARKYSPVDTKVRLSVAQHDDHIRIKVSDKGIGIDKQDIPKLFQKFSRINNPESAAGGTGLGLYWASKLIAMHNGNIGVTSKPGKGTTFTVTIPIGITE